MEEDNIEYLQEEIKEHFMRIQRDRSPGYKPSIRLQAAIEKAAKICAELGATPRDYVEAQYKFRGMEAFYPSLLHTYKAKENYKEHVSPDDNYARMIDVQKNYLRIELVQIGRQVKNVLMDDKISFYPWFRICITKDPIPEVIAKYGKEAKAQMNPKLEGFLRSLGLDPQRIYAA